MRLIIRDDPASASAYIAKYIIGIVALIPLLPQTPPPLPNALR